MSLTLLRFEVLACHGECDDNSRSLVEASYARSEFDGSRLQRWRHQRAYGERPCSFRQSRISMVKCKMLMVVANLTTCDSQGWMSSKPDRGCRPRRPSNSLGISKEGLV